MVWWFVGLGDFHNGTVESQCSGYFAVYAHTLHWLKWTICPNFGDSDGIQKFGDSFFSILVLAEKSFQNIIKYPP